VGAKTNARSYEGPGMTLVVCALLALATACARTPASRPRRVVLNEFGVSTFGDSVAAVPVASQESLFLSLGYRGFALWHPSSFWAPPEPRTLSAYLEQPAVADGRLRMTAVLYAIDASQFDRAGFRSALDSIALAKATPMIMMGSSQPIDLERAVAVVREAAVMAAQVGDGTLVVYPHAGNFIASAEIGQQVLQRVGRDNVKLSLHLSHEIKAGNQNRLPEVIARTVSQVVFVTINGADVEPDASVSDYSHSIRPLDEGNLDVEHLFFRPLLDAGYTGPVILHTHGFPNPPADALRRSMDRWRQMVAAYEAVPLAP
jgi:sugar phosphate isomerase/epimerase